MTPVSLGLDGFLTLLLLAALWVGWRLNAKLKSLKESQAGFVKAVADLDLAAGRAEAGLESLRAATQEAHDTLLDRIDSARTIQARLDRACEDAVAAAVRAEAAAVRCVERPLGRAAERPVESAPPLRMVQALSVPDPDRAAVLRLIETARAEARASAPPLTLVPAAVAEPTPPAPVDRLAAFVARRREARAG